LDVPGERPLMCVSGLHHTGLGRPGNGGRGQGGRIEKRWGGGEVKEIPRRERAGIPVGTRDPVRSPAARREAAQQLRQLGGSLIRDSREPASAIPLF
jgi:hypothetical protein